MDEVLIGRVRRFNRAVTQRVGALDDRYLARDRPLGEARVLWEIGEQGADVRRLRSRLDLDSGHLSRLLRALEADDLITVDRRPDDRRVRTARLTPAGSTERAVLDRRSDELARSLLEPLTGDERARLVSAMGVVEQLLTAALVEIEPADPARPEARHCLGEYFAELGRRVEGFDAALTTRVEGEDLRPPAGLLLVATLRGEPVGCGALRLAVEEPAPAEIKRLWVAGPTRGLGVGRRLLATLEDRARAAGAPSVRLDTNRALTEAIALYRSSGYREIQRFNDEPYAHHWFGKALAGPAAQTSSAGRNR